MVTALELLDITILALLCQRSANVCRALVASYQTQHTRSRCPTTSGGRAGVLGEGQNSRGQLQYAHRQKFGPEKVSAEGKWQEKGWIALENRWWAMQGSNLRPSVCKPSEPERCATDSIPLTEDAEVISWAEVGIGTSRVDTTTGEAPKGRPMASAASLRPY